METNKYLKFKKTKILLLHKGESVDYQNDMVFISLLTNKHIKFDSNIYPEFFFKDYKGSNLYGKGFTLYKKLSSSYKKIGLDYQTIKKRIENRYYDFIIYSSIRRYDKYFNEVTKFYTSNEIICIDGEDDLNFSIKHYLKSHYFKREITDILFKINIEPISFFIPDEILKELRTNFNFNLKKKFLKAYCDPNNTKTYIYNDEKNYYQQYSNSLFGVTKKKGGWDCLRHYEIILCNCLPYFENVEKKPPLIMKGYPVKFQLIANDLFKLNINKKVCDFDMKKYKNLISTFQNYQEEMSTSFGSFKLKNIILLERVKKNFLLSRKKNIFWILYLKIVNLFLLFKWAFSVTKVKYKNPIKRIIYFFLILNSRSYFFYLNVFLIKLWSIIKTISKKISIYIK